MSNFMLNTISSDWIVFSGTTDLLRVTGLHHLTCELKKCGGFFTLKALLLRSNQYRTVLHTY